MTGCRDVFGCGISYNIEKVINNYYCFTTTKFQVCYTNSFTERMFYFIFCDLFKSNQT